MWAPDNDIRCSGTGVNASDAVDVHSDTLFNALFGLAGPQSEYPADEQNREELLHHAATKGASISARKSENIVLAATSSRTNTAPSAGPSNLADDQYARSREDSWHPPLLAITTKMMVSSGSMQHVGQIPARYKGLSDLCKPMPTLLHKSPQVSPEHNCYKLPKSCSSNVPPRIQSPTPAATNSSSLSIEKKCRLLRHRRSRDLSNARRTFLNDLAITPSTMQKVNDSQHLGQGPAPLDQIMSYTTPLSRLATFDEYDADIPGYPAPSVSPRPLSSARSEYFERNSYSISAEDLHARFKVHEAAMLARPHSSSTLDCDVPENGDADYPVRRTNDPNDMTFLQQMPVSRQYSAEEYTPWATGICQQPLVHRINESPLPESSESSQQWWGENAKVDDFEERWTGNENLSHHLNPLPHSIRIAQSSPSLRRYNTQLRVMPAENPYGQMFFLRQTPSPPFDDEENGMFDDSMRRSGSSVSSVPSPPDSPGYYMSTTASQLPTPEIGFPVTPALSQDAFGNVYSHAPGGPMDRDMHRQASIPLTPPSRPSSSHTTAAIAGAAAALATAASAKNTPKTKPSSRPGSSRRKASNGSMRSQVKACMASSMAAQVEHEVSFVNYTPNDAPRLLSGVAPSGSSKTKARREREAKEKSRKLSEAAAAAVLAAGGDASALMANVDLL